MSFSFFFLLALLACLLRADVCICLHAQCRVAVCSAVQCRRRCCLDACRFFDTSTTDRLCGSWLSQFCGCAPFPPLPYPLRVFFLTFHYYVLLACSTACPLLTALCVTVHVLPSRCVHRLGCLVSPQLSHTVVLQVAVHTHQVGVSFGGLLGLLALVSVGLRSHVLL